MKKWLVLFVMLWRAAPAIATPGAFASANGYWPTRNIPQFGLGALVKVDYVNTPPNRVTIICSAYQMGIANYSERRALFSSSYTAGAGEMSLDELAAVLTDINVANHDDVLISLSAGMEHVESYSLPNSSLPVGLSEISQDCLVRLAQSLQEEGASRQIVVVNSELMADVDVRAVWSRARMPLHDRVSWMGHVADMLHINGGQIGVSSIRAPFQRIGWQHDQGAWLRAVVLP